MLDRWFKAVGVKNIELELNSLGCKQCRPAFREALIDYMKSRSDKLCDDCKRRLEKNPLRVLDCKEPGCKEAARGAPVVLDFLDEDCKSHFEAVKKDLEVMGVSYRVNPAIVRGLDYYTRTVFEYTATAGLGAQNAVAAGGRYDGLVEEFGGPPTPAIGFALGVERVELLMEEAKADAPDYFIVTLGERERVEGIKLLIFLRDKGMSADMNTDDLDKSFKSQMKAAGRSGANYVFIIGEQELAGSYYSVKEMKSGEQYTIPKAELIHDDFSVHYFEGLIRK